MGDQVPKTKKTRRRSVSVSDTRRRSSGSSIEFVVSTIMEAEARGLCLSSQMEKYPTTGDKEYNCNGKEESENTR